MKLFAATLCLIGWTAALGAQKTQTESKSKVTVKDGETMTVTGCVTPTAGGSGLALTNVADKNGDLHNYALISDDNDLRKHVGHRVQLTGKATDRGDGKVSVETKTKTKVEGGEDRESTTKTESQGDLNGLPIMSVKSFKMIAATCP